jgi:hypothetical protein
VAIASAPLLVGVLGDLVGVRLGLLLVPVLCLVSAGLVLVAPSRRRPVVLTSG